MVALGLLAAACSNGGSSSAGSTPSTAKGAGTSPTGTPAPADFNQPSFTGSPRTGGSVTIGVEANVASLDPAGNLIQVSDIDTGLALYDPLVSFDDKGNFGPALATKWTNSADLKTWTITLRTGVTFGDGTPFGPDAVVKQYERLKDPATQCACIADVSLISAVKATGPSTVTFTLTQPNAFFVSALAKPTAYIASPTAVAKWGKDYARHPVGTGPFELKSYDPLVLVRNPHYWKKDAKGRSLPYLQQITVKPITDNQVRLQSLESGAIDLMQVGDTATIINALATKKFTVQKITGSASTTLSFNNRKPPFSDVRLRQAVAYAVNRDEINQVLYKGALQPAYSSFSITSPYYDANAGWLKYDPAKAKQLVAAAKADGEPTSFTLTCVTSDQSRSLLAIVKRQLAAVGLNADLTFVDQGAYVNQLLGAAHDYTMGCSRNGATVTPDLYDGWYSTGANNAEGFNDKKADSIMVAIRKTTDPKQLVTLAGQLQHELGTQVPGFPLVYDLFANVATTSISGLNRPEPNQLGAIQFAYLYRKV